MICKRIPKRVQTPEWGLTPERMQTPEPMQHHGRMQNHERMQTPEWALATDRAPPPQRAPIQVGSLASVRPVEGEHLQPIGLQMPSGVYLGSDDDLKNITFMCVHHNCSM